VGRFHAVIGDQGALDGNPRLFVVESRPLGSVRARLSRAGVPVVDPVATPAR
jgi:hypothetical protein